MKWSVKFSIYYMKAYLSMYCHVTLYLVRENEHTLKDWIWSSFFFSPYICFIFAALFFSYFKDRWGSTLSRIAHFGSSHLPTGVLQQLSRADETITKIVMVRFWGFSFGDYHAWSTFRFLTGYRSIIPYWYLLSFL